MVPGDGAFTVRTSMPIQPKRDPSVCPSPDERQSGPRYSVFSAAGMWPLAWLLKVGVKSCW